MITHQRNSVSQFLVCVRVPRTYPEEELDRLKKLASEDDDGSSAALEFQRPIVTFIQSTLESAALKGRIITKVIVLSLLTMAGSKGQRTACCSPLVRKPFVAFITSLPQELFSLNIHQCSNSRLSDIRTFSNNCITNPSGYDNVIGQ